MRVIDADVCLSQLKPYSPEDENWSVTGGTAIRLIHNAVNNTPTINPLDVLGIFQCKDCIHFGFGNEKWSYCVHEHGLSDPKETDYCPYAKRKENNNV